MSWLESIKKRYERMTLSPSFMTSAKNLSLFSGGNFVAQLCMMVHAILVARVLNLEQLGIYSGLYALLGVSVTFVHFGQDTWMLSVANHGASVRQLSGQVFLKKLVLGVLWLAICLIVLPAIRPTFYTRLIVSLAAIEVLFETLINTIVAAWTIEKNVKEINRSLLYSRFGKLSVLILLVATGNATVIAIIASRLIISVAVLTVSSVSLKPQLVNNKDRGLVEKIKLFVSQTAPFGISELLAVVYANADVAILSFYSLLQTGLYSPASGIIHALFIIPNSFYSYFLPHNSSSFEVTDATQIRIRTRNLLTIFIPLGIFLALSVILGGRYLFVPLLGQKFQNSVSLLYILSPIMLLKSVSYGLAIMLVSLGLQSKRLIPQFISAFFDLLLVFFLAQNGGAIAVAWVYVFSETILALGYYYLLEREIRKLKR